MDKQVFSNRQFSDERGFTLEADFFKALSHPTRLRILKKLRDNERCVCEFTQDFDMEQSNISQHLGILRKQGIVSCRKDGLKVIYRTNHPEIYQLLDLAEELIVSQVNETLNLLDSRKDKRGGE